MEDDLNAICMSIVNYFCIFYFKFETNMLLRKPTSISLKPEDDYLEYEEFKSRQE